MVFLSELHHAFGSHKLHALHGGDELFGVRAAGRCDGFDNSAGGSKPPTGKEIRGFVEAFHVLGHQPVIDGIARIFIVIVNRADHALERFPGFEGRQHIAAAGDLDAILIQPAFLKFVHRAVLSGPDHKDILGLRFILESPDDFLDRRRKIRGFGIGILLMNNLGAEFLSRLLVSRNPVPTKGIILGDGGDANARFGNGDGVGDGILA